MLILRCAYCGEDQGLSTSYTRELVEDDLTELCTVCRNRYNKERKAIRELYQQKEKLMQDDLKRLYNIC